MTQTKTYMGTGGAHTSSHGFVNYIGGGKGSRERALAEVWSEHPDAIIVDGTDDWYAERSARPETFPGTFKITILGYFHTGISGISKSGIVLNPEQFALLSERYQAEYNKPINTTLRVYLPEQKV